VSVTLQLVNVSSVSTTVLETINLDISGIDPDSFTTIPELVNCGAFPCALESFSFTGIVPDPSVSFSVMSGSTDIAFSVVPESPSWVMLGLGFAGLAYGVLAPAALRSRSLKERLGAIENAF